MTAAADPDRWERMKSPFHAALELPPAQRDAFLVEACAGDVALLAELRSLLASHDEAGHFLEEPAGVPATVIEGEDADAMLGATVGPYRIVEVIGYGGMGTVYRAVRTDDVYEKAVALKLVKRGMDTDFVLRRFRSERQILAQLDHPNIARLLDGGTSPDGRPYFVMEFIEGLPLDRYADGHGLDTRARLALFLATCAAVQHAHQSLVVHRDLKPANILVTAEGGLKLLDFGIAKLLDPTTQDDGTATVVRLMTPEYASPEQVRGEPITTATDVYALGVVLYELLSGRRPHEVEGRNPDELAHAICFEDPRPPNTWLAGAGTRRHLAEELDNIVLMALRKEPSRRYASVEQLAEDVRCHLEGRPVRAQKDTLVYRAGKFLRRNRLPAAAAAAVGLTLVAGIVTTSWQARVARAERARAERRFGDVRRLANALLFQLDDAIRDLSGSTRARELLAAQALQYLDSLAGEAEGDAGLQRELAAAYCKVGDVQGRPGVANLGDYAGARASYEKALALYTRLAAAAPSDVALQGERVACQLYIARLQEDGGDLDGATSSLNAARAAAVAAERLAPGDVNLQRHLVNVDLQLGNLQVYRGDLDAAIETEGRAVRRAATLSAAHPGDLSLRRPLAQAHVNLARAFRETRSFARALELYGEARKINEGLIAAEPVNVRHRRNLSLVHTETGNVLTDMARWPEAVASARQALALTAAQVAADPDNADAKHMLLIEDLLLCRAETPLLRRVSASCRSAVVRAEALAAAAPGQGKPQQDVIKAYRALGTALKDTGDRAGAREAFRQQLSLAEAASRAWPGDPRPRTFIAEAHAGIGDVFRADRDWPNALVSYRAAVALREPAAAAGHPRAEVELCHLRSAMAAVLAEQARRAPAAERGPLWSETREAYRQALDLLERASVRGALGTDEETARQKARRGLAESEAALSAAS
jgi:eukaryotic-like serine/threonine-protein kinase